MKEEIDIYHSSDNEFADLKLPDAEESF